MELNPNDLADAVKRLRRAQGQIGGVIQMIENGRSCTDVLTQLAAASRAVDRAGFKIISAGLEQCMIDQKNGQEQAAANRLELEKLFLALA